MMNIDRFKLIKRMHKLGINHLEGVNHFTIPLQQFERIILLLELKFGGEVKNKMTNDVCPRRSKSTIKRSQHRK